MGMNAVLQETMDIISKEGRYTVVSFLQEKQVQKINRKDLETKTISLRTCLLVYQSIKISVISRTYSPNNTTPVKRIPGCISLSSVKGSVTVEAALALPIALFFLLNLISVISIFRVHSAVEAALHQVGSKMAVYAYAAETITDTEGIGMSPLMSVALSETYVKESVMNYLGEAYLEASPIKNGKQGISFVLSKLMEEDDVIDLIAVYEVEPAFGMIGFQSFRVVNRCRVRAWTGYDNKHVEVSSEDGEEIVYITENGTVYHRDRSCTHLQLSIQAVEYERIAVMRNVYGSKYKQCERCKLVTDGSVYITKQGDCYHSDAGCSGLKRTVIAILFREIGGKKPCLRCA